MEERPSDADNTPDDAQAPLEPETAMEDTLAAVEPPDYAEPPFDEPPVDIEPPEDVGPPLDEPLIDPEPSDYVEYSFGAEPPASLEQLDYDHELPIEAGTPTVDLTQAEIEPPTSLEQLDYGDELPVEAAPQAVDLTQAEVEPPTSLEQLDYGDELPVEAAPQAVELEQAKVESWDDASSYDADVMAAVDSEPASVEPHDYVEPSPDAESPDYATVRFIDEGPGGGALYEAFVPRRVRRDRIAAMSYPSAIEMVSKRRKKGDPAELGEVELSDEEIAAAIQDYARGVDTEEERTNWLLGQILEEQYRQTRHLRGVKTVLILLIAAMALAAIASCVLMFVQIPNLMP